MFRMHMDNIRACARGRIVDEPFVTYATCFGFGVWLTPHKFVVVVDIQHTNAVRPHHTVKLTNGQLPNLTAIIGKK